MIEKNPEMLKKNFPFKIGLFECQVLNDGAFKRPDEAPEDALEMQCLLIRTGKNTVLIDTGWGVGVGVHDGKLMQNLQAAGIQRTEIDTVILPHFHPDHVSGNTDAEGRAVFSNARYILHKKEWEFWTSDPDLTRMGEDLREEMVQSVKNSLIPIQDQVELVEDETEIVPGIEAIWTPGHTPGHIVLVISSGSEQLLCTGDLFHRKSEFERPDLRLPFDWDQEQAIQTRVQILSRFATNNPLVFVCHFPFPGLGHIVPKGNTWLWQPIDITA
jgi:glyoxylase-like metal-dependent hydrolase (beta-lactamase superfamily II)